MIENMKGLKLLVDGSWGIYVPNQFMTKYTPEQWGIKTDDAAILMRGPDDPDYWETWDEVLTYAKYAFGGKTYMLYQDGDLWAYPMEDNLED